MINSRPRTRPWRSYRVYARAERAYARRNPGFDRAEGLLVHEAQLVAELTGAGGHSQRAALQVVGLPVLPGITGPARGHRCRTRFRMRAPRQQAKRYGPDAVNELVRTRKRLKTDG